MSTRLFYLFRKFTPGSEVFFFGQKGNKKDRNTHPNELAVQEGNSPLQQSSYAPETTCNTISVRQVPVGARMRRDLLLTYSPGGGSVAGCQGFLSALLVLMAFLLGGWFKTDDDDINDLPPDLRDFYVNPWKVKGTSCPTAANAAFISRKSAIETNCLQWLVVYCCAELPADAYERCSSSTLTIEI